MFHPGIYTQVNRHTGPWIKSRASLSDPVSGEKSPPPYRSAGHALRWYIKWLDFRPLIRKRCIHAPLLRFRENDGCSMYTLNRGT